MGVKTQQELKRRLKAVQARMLVVKNTLLKRAGEQAKIDQQLLTDSVLSGQNALIVSEEDSIIPIQILGKFAAEFDVPAFKVGLVEGKSRDSETLLKLAKLPGKDVLLSQLLGTLRSPVYGLVSVLSGNMQKLVYMLNAKLT